MELVKPITSDHDLIELADKINVHLDGILEINEIKKPLNKGTHIILLRKDNGVGHWVCQMDGEYFDSTSVGPPTKLGKLKYNEFQYQGSYSEYCGIFCLLWLYSKQHNKPYLLENFINLDIDIV